MKYTKFIYLNDGDTIYHIKMVDYQIVKENGKDTFTTLKAQKVSILSAAYLDVLLDNGETIFPNIHNKAHTMIQHVNGQTIHRIYSMSKKECLESAIESVRNRVVSIRAEVDNLKNKELSCINTMSDMLKLNNEINDDEDEVTAEQFATMAL